MTLTATDRAAIATETAKLLLDIGAVEVWSGQPYTFTSGLVSPVYIDCRKVMSHPDVRERIITHACTVLRSDIGFDTIDALVGGETAGIPFAAWMAAELRLPMQYVRKKPKGFAKYAQVEGDIVRNQSVVLVEDLTTDGATKLRFAQALRRAGMRVEHTVMIFYYDIFAQTRERLRAENMTLHALATWQDILSIARESEEFLPQTVSEIETFLEDPLAWSADHGGAAQIQL